MLDLEANVASSRQMPSLLCSVAAQGSHTLVRCGHCQPNPVLMTICSASIQHTCVPRHSHVHETVISSTARRQAEVFDRLDLSTGQRL